MSGRLTKIFALVVGDWSGDGHEKTIKVLVKTNFTEDEIEKAYKKAVRIVGVDLTKDVCRNYDERRIPYDKFKELIKFDEIFELYEGISKEITEKDFKSDTWISYVEPSHFADLYLAFCKIGNPDFRYKVINANNINVGGYGLFS